MISHTIVNEALARCGSSVRCDPVLFGRVVVDSRIARPGDIFCAFKGERTNAHVFVPDLVARGVLCIGTEPLGIEGYVQVTDIVLFLAVTARLRRDAQRSRVIAITGSSGKTTTRALAMRMLEKSGVIVHGTRGNLNNHIGVPLVLLETPLSCDVIVLEMGMNHAGEIATLCQIADPDVAIITNIGCAHIGNFDSREALAEAKLELFEHSRGSTAINLDDPFVVSWADAHPARKGITYGIKRCDGDLWACQEQGFLRLRWFGAEYRFPMPRVPEYQVENLLAAAAIAAPFIRDIRVILRALETCSLPPYRGEEVHDGERCFVVDCYNANPDSMQKSIADFVARAGEAADDLPCYLILGDMAELGRFSEKYHRELVNYLKTLTVIKRSFLLGEEFEKVRDESIDDERFHFSHSVEEIAAALPVRGRFLVKGSRRNRLERLFASDDGGE